MSNYDFIRQHYSYRELLNMMFSRKSFREDIVIALTEDVHSLMRTSEWTLCVDPLPVALETLTGETIPVV